MPDNFEGSVCAKLNAINFLRTGKIDFAFHDLNLAFPDSLAILNDIDRQALYELSRDNREEWKLHMQDLAGVLAAEGY